MVLPNSIRLPVWVIVVVPILLFSLILSSCEDVGLFVEHLDDEVKLANDRYLEIIGVYPSQNDQEINPSVPLLITFDRAVSPETMQNGGWIDVKIQDSLLNTKDFVDELGGTLDMKFYSVDNTLRLSAFPYFSGGAKIIVSLLAGMPAEDGTFLRDTISWSFYTGKLPAGSLKINDGVNPALPGFISASGPVGLTIDYSREVSDYYFTAENNPDSIDYQYLITENDAVITANWTEVTVDPPVTTETVDIPDGEDGKKSVFIRFYDYEEEVFSPIIKATTILDTKPPIVLPEFSGNNRVADGAEVHAGASDENGIQAGAYVWESEESLPSGSTLVFGNSNAASTSVYLFENPIENKILARIEADISLQVTALDSAGHSSIGIIGEDLEWDRYVAQPNVTIAWDFVDNPDRYLQEELSRTFPSSLHLISEYFLENSKDYLRVDWSVEMTAVPNNDLEFFYMGVNNFVSSIRNYEIDLDKDIREWFASDIQGFNYGPQTKEQMPGYFNFTTTLVDKLGNRSDPGSDYVSFIPDSFIKILDAATTWEGVEDVSGIWPYRIKELNRYPSFSWPLMTKKINEFGKIYGGTEYLYYKLMINKDSPSEIVVSDVNTPYWFHSGPDDLAPLESSTEDGWWFEIWVDENLDGPDDDERVLSSVTVFGGSFPFTTGQY